MKVRVGEKAPGFSLNGFSLEEAVEPVLLAFFKITCPTCQLAFPFLQRLADRGGPRIVGVSQDGPEGTAEFAEAFGIRFPLVMDPVGAGYHVSNRYGLTHVPSLLLVEPGGEVSWTSEGFVKADLTALAERFGIELFAPGDRAPVFKPG